MPSGTLYVVATPLGHLGDLTARAAETLRRVPVVVAEDTRHSRKLLSHLEAHPRLLSSHAHSGPGAARAVLGALAQGEDVALVTDAGTPAISDPGAELVREARAAGYVVVPIPGPSAVATALSAAGLPADRYLFLGFLPRKGTERSRLLGQIAKAEWTTVVFEAPGRVAGLLEDLASACGGARNAVVARELTKIHEEFRPGTLDELVTLFGDDGAAPRGECTVLIEGAGPAAPDDSADRARPAAIRLLAAGVSRKEVASLLTELFGVARNEAYRLAVESSEP
jgi:16S rRNA (cytidine1402-2'-O)-methyltransferase